LIIVPSQGYGQNINHSLYMFLLKCDDIVIREPLIIHVILVILECIGEKLDVAHVIYKRFSFVMLFCGSELNYED
jgi:hypothetical protein